MVGHGLSDLPPEIINEILIRLPPPALAALCRTCSSLWKLGVPILYHAIDLFFSGAIDNQVLHKLECLSTIRPEVIDSIRELRVLGSWFIIYDEIESDLGSSKKLSPATKMFSALLAHLTQNSKLRLFSWDLPLTATERLLHSLSRLPTLETLAVRMSADHTSSPYYFPLRHLHNFKSLRSLSVTAIVELANLKEIGQILTNKTLEHLQITAGGLEVFEAPMTVFEDVDEKDPIVLRSLDIRGFDVSSLPGMWRKIDPSQLERLTIKLPEDERLNSEEEFNQFWTEILKLNESTDKVSGIHTLYTDAVCMGLMKCISSFVNHTPIQRLFFLPCVVSLLEPDIIDQFLEENLPKLGPSIKTLALFSLNRNERNILMNFNQLMEFPKHCQCLEELGVAVTEKDAEKILPNLASFSKLRSLYIIRDSTKPERTRGSGNTHPHSSSGGGYAGSSSVSSSLADDLDFMHRTAAIVDRYPELQLRYFKLDQNPVYEFVRLRPGTGKGLSRRRSARRISSSPHSARPHFQTLRIERRGTRLYDDGLDSYLFSRKIFDW